MKLSSKYFRVMFKLYVRSLKRSPHVLALSLMGLTTFALSSVVFVDAWVHGNRFAESSFTQWEQFQKDMTGRHIASSDLIQCNYNDIDLNLLKNEIKGLETQYETGHFIEGSLFSINLKSLPAIQAQYLADFGEFIGSQNQSQNFSECKSLPCILTKLYNGDELSGHLAYYWYLKTGSMLSVGNNIPGQQSKIPGFYSNQEYPLSSYLFSSLELRNFYVLAKSLPEKFLHLPLLKSIHKIPSHSIEGLAQNECATATPSGQILITQACLGNPQDIKSFLLKMSAQMAHFIDIYEGKKDGASSVSHSQFWLDKSLWLKDNYFDVHGKKYSSKWFSFLPKNEFISEESKVSPASQFAQLVAAYRFNPEKFAQNTPQELQSYIKEKFFNGLSYTGNGLYTQYVTSAMNLWSKEEGKLWEDCFDQHLNPENTTISPRELASQIDNPLFTCVEKKIPSFVNSVEEDIKAKYFEGCQFFTDGQQFGHLSRKFHHVLDKYLQEKVLKRKIEFQNHGEEVILGQKIKDEFITSIDPASVFISCYESSDQKSCYQGRLSSEFSKILGKYGNKVSDYYKNILTQDTLQMYSFEEVAESTNRLAKKFIAPFYNRIHFAATDLWAGCKDEKFSANKTIDLPLKFTGGKYFVNAKLLNCINSKMDDELYNIANLTAFQEVDEKLIEFKLNKQEKEFALSFMEGKLIQILNNILQEEVELEKVRLSQHFKDSQESISENLLSFLDTFDEVYSQTQVSDECLDKVSEFYPQKIFYSAPKEVDSKFGRSICSTMMKDQRVKTKISEKVKASWDENKTLVSGFLDAHFAELVDECNDDYPIEKGRSQIRNTRMRKLCIEESFGMAVNEAIGEWREDDKYEYFSSREQELINNLYSLKNDKIQKALQ